MGKGTDSALFDANEYLIAGLENQAEWWEHLGDAHRDYAALARMAVAQEAELARLREERDALAEAQQFPVETIMSWKRQVDDAKRRSASALLLLDPERQDEPDEENARRAFEILSGLRPPTFRPDRERAEAAEARLGEAHRECARLQQALREIEKQDGRYSDLNTARYLARQALAGPDTPEEEA